jgi:phosphomannomutase
MKIEFGTDGWRGVIARDFTFERVAIVTQAIANRVKKSGKGRGVLVGYDTRFLSREFAEESARVLAGNKLRVLFSESHVPTPVVSFGVRELKLDGAVMITASHNPYMFNGIKFKGDYGGSALPSFTMAVEKELNSGKVIPKKDGAVKINHVNLKEKYIKHLKGMIDFEILKKKKRKVVLDSMYGAGTGYLTHIFELSGWDCIPFRNEINPSFGGYNPEPCLPNVNPLIEAVLENKADMGFAVDGDADRIGAVDEKGNFVDSHKIFALILRYLVEKKKWNGEVAKTITVSDMIDKLCAKYNLKLHVTPVGFKHICNLMLTRNILMGGEESGGIGITRHMPERDGIFNALLLAEMCNVYNKPLSRLVDDLMDFVGYHTFKRVDLHIHSKDQLKNFLAGYKPVEISGLRVRNTDTRDGQKFFLEDNSWLMFRLSGTEPVLRVYCEADSIKKVNKLIESGMKTLSKYL